MKLLLVYLCALIPGQALAIGIGLAADSVSKATGVAAFIIAYYGMFWVAWRITLFVIDRPTEQERRASLASVVLAPAVLAFDLAE